MKTLTPADVPALKQILGSSSANAALAALLEVEEKPFSTSIAAGYELLDVLTPDDEFVSVNFGEHRSLGYVTCEIDNDGHFNGDHLEGKNRADALFGAIISALCYRLETGIE